MRTRYSFSALIVLSLLVSGCGILATAKPGARLPPGIEKGVDPSGRWLYEEGGQSLVLDLDADGNGDYPWKGGIFRTYAISGRLWTGTWHQAGNDREGGFEIEMDTDFNNGTGRWWYTRIGDNSNPLQPGGRFFIERQSARP